MRPLRKIALILLIIVVLPALVYLVGRVHSLNENEALLEEIYEQQFKTMLYSVNQHAWDVSSNWAGQIGRLLSEQGNFERVADQFFSTTPVVSALVFSDTSLKGLQVLSKEPTDQEKWTGLIEGALNRSIVKQLLERKRVGFQQLQPTLLENGEDGPMFSLVFVQDRDPRAQIVGMVVNGAAFTEDVIGPKMMSLARDRYVMGVFKPGIESPLYSTDSLRRSDVHRIQEHWFPDYLIGIQLKGLTIADALQARFERDLAFIGLAALVLIIGGALIYRNVRREVDLARIKSDFVANVSHELRTPLSLIRMYAETLEMGRVASDDRRHRYYRIISQETERLTHLINNILNFSRIDAGRKSYQFAPTDLNALVADVMDRYAFTLQQQGFDVDIDLREHLPLIKGDDEAIAEAFINIIDNAAKYSEEEKHICVATGRAGEYVYVDVEDRGMGIPRGEQEKIFEQFYRISDSLVHDTKGTGLGLALVKHIIDAHGGDIDVESKPGQGSRFRLAFQIASEPEETPSTVVERIKELS